MTDIREQREFFARCASGFEDILARELRELRIRRVRPLKGGVAFFGGRADAYRACLWSRVATRIQLVIARIPADDAEALYRGIMALPWEEQVREGATIAVQAHGVNRSLRNTQFTALKVKDALCDRLRQARGGRPDVNPMDPDCLLEVALHERKATVLLNLSGASLHRRGYREEGVQAQAPLKETLAAGMLLAAGWDAMVHDACAAEVPQGVAAVAFADPMCGSGTLVLEAALIAADIAPGMLRTRWGFQGWAQHDSRAWAEVAAQAGERSEARRALLQEADGPHVKLVGCDIDARAVQIARGNAERAEVDDIVEIHESDASELGKYLRIDGQVPQVGLLAVNPPYGHRLQLQGFPPREYQALAAAVDSLPAGWRLAAITPDAAIDAALGVSARQVRSCYNGPLEVGVRLYDAPPAARTRLQVVSLSGIERAVPVLEENSSQFAARLRKVGKERSKWASREGVRCLRIYDSDLPDYAISVDVYEGAGPDEGCRFVRVAEYQAPAEVDADRAARRFSDAMALVPAILDVDPARVFAKVRRRAKGGGQYREARAASFVAHTAEGGYLFEIDLGGYLDTGLFLDHRDTRMMVGRMAQGKRFLNLFAYTGSATVHAAGGGAASTTTVDLSQTYLAWARRNMELNGFMSRQHRFERGDTIPWLRGQAKRGLRYDLVFCDPPTFSNSKAMEGHVFDVQRDHVKLLRAVKGVLAPGGTIVFSCNRRNFKLDADALAAVGLQAEDITPQTIPHDFARTPKVHRCFLVTRVGA